MPHELAPRKSWAQRKIEARMLPQYCVDDGIYIIPSVIQPGKWELWIDLHKRYTGSQDGCHKHWLNKA